MAGQTRVDGASMKERRSRRAFQVVMRRLGWSIASSCLSSCIVGGWAIYRCGGRMWRMGIKWLGSMLGRREVVECCLLYPLRKAWVLFLLLLHSIFVGLVYAFYFSLYKAGNCTRAGYFLSGFFFFFFQFLGIEWRGLGCLEIGCVSSIPFFFFYLPISPQNWGFGGGFSFCYLNKVWWVLIPPFLFSLSLLLSSRWDGWMDG